MANSPEAWFLAQVYELSLAHYPLPECGYCMLIYTHIIPFGQGSVTDEYDAPRFCKKHYRPIQQLHIFFRRF